MSAVTGNKQSVKILDELLQKLSVADDEQARDQASHNLASFINGAIEEQEYVFRNRCINLELTSLVRQRKSLTH